MDSGGGPDSGQPPRQKQQLRKEKRRTLAVKEDNLEEERGKSVDRPRSAQAAAPVQRGKIDSKRVPAQGGATNTNGVRPPDG